MAKLTGNEQILLCATRFWANSTGMGVREDGGTLMTLRAGVRHVARKQGVTPSELDRAERSLIKKGLLERGGRRTGASLRVTPSGMHISCKRVKLPPWKPKWNQI